MLAATMLAGRVGSAMAAELGTMRVTEQIDALSALGHEPDPLPGRAAIPGLPAPDPAADAHGRLHGRDRRRRDQHPGAGRRLVRLLAALARLRREPRHLRRRLQELLLRRGDRADQLPPRLQLEAGAEGVGKAATEAFVFSFIAILFLDFTSAWAGTPCIARSGRRPRGCYERGRPGGPPSGQPVRRPDRAARRVACGSAHQSVLRDINLTIHEGETVCVIGESGCGKTVMLKLIIGLLRPTTGSVAVRRPRRRRPGRARSWSRCGCGSASCSRWRPSSTA